MWNIAWEDGRIAWPDYGHKEQIEINKIVADKLCKWENQNGKQDLNSNGLECKYISCFADIWHGEKQ
jgi:hypothetical protein